MTRAPRLKGKEIVFVEHPDGRATSVPTHTGEIIGPGLFRSILRDVEMTIEEFVKFL